MQMTKQRISVVLPTYNEKENIPAILQELFAVFSEYDLEIIIVDDGSDSIEDLVKDIPQVRYFREEQQMVLGRKRNYMHEKARDKIKAWQAENTKPFKETIQKYH